MPDRETPEQRAAVDELANEILATEAQFIGAGSLVSLHNTIVDAISRERAIVAREIAAAEKTAYDRGCMDTMESANDELAVGREGIEKAARVAALEECARMADDYVSVSELASKRAAGTALRDKIRALIAREEKPNG